MKPIPIKSTFLALLIYLGNTVPSSAMELPQIEPVPGGVALIMLPNSEKRPEAHFLGKPLLVIKHQDHWKAVVGLPLGVIPGTQRIRVKDHKGEMTYIPFEIHAKEYETQHITITDKRKVNPTKMDMDRIGKESARINAALEHFSATLPDSLRLNLPVQGRESSPFGLRRFFNKQPRKPHSGLDIAAPEGTPIHAPAPGVVVETGDFFFNGNTVFLDHGNGLVTMYCHMHEIQVKPGQSVASGEIIGTVGKTGRATGPHLHWGVSLNDARVDPKLFLREASADPGPAEKIQGMTP